MFAAHAMPHFIPDSVVSLKGNAAFKAGDYPTAIGHYTAAFIADPANATYPLNRAAAYLKLGKWVRARSDLFSLSSRSLIMPCA